MDVKVPIWITYGANEKNFGGWIRIVRELKLAQVIEIKENFRDYKILFLLVI